MLVCRVCLEDLGAPLKGLHGYHGVCAACGLPGPCYSVVEALEAAQDKLSKAYDRLLKKFTVA